MYRNVAGQENTIVQAQQDASPLSAEEQAALENEVAYDPTARGYGGKTAEEILTLGSVGWWSENPEAQGRIPRGVLPGSQFYGDLVQYGVTAAVTLLPDNTPVPQGVPAQYTPAVVKRLVEDTRHVQIVNTGNAQTIALMQIAVAYGLLSMEGLQDLLTVPDPAWNNQIWNEPRWTTLFGAGNVPTIDEITQAMGA